MSVRDRTWLLVLALIFVAWHVPLEYRTGAGQDEDYYGITGSMTLRNGLPSLPFVPARDPHSAAYKADTALYILPPLNCYLQAVVHFLFGDGLGPARLTSTLMGLAAMFLVSDLARIWYGEGRVAVLSATAFVISRAFLFPATTARPDMATATFGLLALWLVVRHRRASSDRVLVGSGAAAGLALLCHPYGIVPAIEVGTTVLAEPGGPGKRLRKAAIYTGVALVVFALWLPLIALHPDLFWVQFRGNVLDRALPWLGGTTVAPQGTLIHQARRFCEHVQPLQAGLYVVALVWAGVGGAHPAGGGRSSLIAWGVAYSWLSSRANTRRTVTMSIRSLFSASRSESSRPIWPCASSAGRPRSTPGDGASPPCW